MNTNYEITIRSSVPLYKCVVYAEKGSSMGFITTEADIERLRELLNGKGTIARDENGEAILYKAICNFDQNWK